MKKSKLRQRYTAIILIFAMIIVACVSVAVYAEYTKSSRAKRVIASYESEGVLFSSNYLLHSSGNANDAHNRKIIYTGDPGNPVITSVSVCNFAQGNPSKVYERDIEYGLYAQLVVVSGNTRRAATAADVGALTVQIQRGDEAPITLNASNLSATYLPNSTLNHRASSSDIYLLTFSSGFNTDEAGICLYMSATPIGNYIGISPIDAIFSTSVNTDRTRDVWRGYFNEAGALGVSGASLPTAFDGFNYVIAGYGVGTCRLSWNTEKLELNELFLDELGLDSTDIGSATVSGDVWHYIDFPVDSDTINRYDTQFYRSDGDVNSFAAWSEVSDCVTMVFTET